MTDKSATCLRLLKSSVVDERLQAVRLFSDLNPINVDLYFQAFGDPDWRVRKEAVRLFVATPGVERHATAVIGLLHDAENAGLRNSAIETLICLGSLVVPELMDSIRCPDADVRKFVIDVLGEIGSQQCADEVLGALNDGDTNVRYAAVETLGKLSLDRATGPLLELMENADTGLRFTILEALSAIGETVPVDQLSRYLEDPVLRKALLECFGRIGGAEVIPHLITGLADPVAKVRRAASSALIQKVKTQPGEVARALHAAPSVVMENLTQLLKDAEWQPETIKLAAQLRTEEMAQQLLSLLPQEHLRGHVVDAFRSREDAFFDQLLTPELCDAPNTRHCLIYLAGELERTSARSLAVSALFDEDPQQRHTAAETLGRIGDRDSIHQLLTLLRDEVTEVREAATRAVERLVGRYPQTIAKSLGALSSMPDPEQRARAVRILAADGVSHHEAVLQLAFKDPDAGVRGAVIRALGREDVGPFNSALRLALNDEVAEVRRLAAERLRDVPADEALPALELALADPDPWVRTAAVHALQAFPGERTTQVLTERLADPVGLVVIATLKVLAQQQYSEILEHQPAVLEHSDEEVVKTAVELLIRQVGEAGRSELFNVLLSYPRPEVRRAAIRDIDRYCGRDGLCFLEARIDLETDDAVNRALRETVALRQRARD